MDLLKELGKLIEQATSDANPTAPIQTYEKILALINSRVDMYFRCELGLNIR